MVDVFINGQEGRLESRFLPPRTPKHPVVVLLHPHPKQGGQMDNAVIQAMCCAFHELGFGTLRFNFRGVGRSQGEFGDSDGELNDAASVVDWLQSSQRIAYRIWISGFSYGAWIAMQLLMRRPEIEGFVVASLPAHAFDFSFLAPCPVSGQILYGENDPIIPVESMRSLVSRLNSQKSVYVDYQVIPGADHSFTGKLEELKGVMTAYLQRALEKDPLLAAS